MQANDDLIKRGVARKITPRGETDITPFSSGLPVTESGSCTHVAVCVFGFQPIALETRVLGLILLLTPVQWWSVSLLWVTGAH